MSQSRFKIYGWMIICLWTFLGTWEISLWMKGIPFFHGFLLFPCIGIPLQFYMNWKYKK